MCSKYKKNKILFPVSVADPVFPVWDIFAENCIKIERVWRGGGGAPPWHPLRFALLCFSHMFTSENRREYHKINIKIKSFARKIRIKTSSLHTYVFTARQMFQYVALYSLLYLKLLSRSNCFHLH